MLPIVGNMLRFYLKNPIFKHSVAIATTHIWLRFVITDAANGLKVICRITGNAKYIYRQLIS